MDKTLQTMAWRCLPREFKEEVKKEYYDCKHCNADACAIELENLFGIHNLTSDMDGEDVEYESKPAESTTFNIEYKDIVALHYDLIKLEKSVKTVRELIDKIYKK